MLGFAESGQVSVNSRHGRTLVAEVDLDLPEVLTLLQEMGGVGMAQTVNMSGFLTPLARRPRRKARCRVVRLIGSVAVAAPCPL